MLSSGLLEQFDNLLVRIIVTYLRVLVSVTGSQDVEDISMRCVFCAAAAAAAGFMSEVESREEGDAHSTSSFPYDDIDEARPLASQGATDDATDDATDGAASEPPEHLSPGASSGKFGSAFKDLPGQFRPLFNVRLFS